MKKLDSLGISAFFESMAMMLQSGIQVDEAVGLLAESATAGKDAGPLEKGLYQMKAKVEEGSNLSRAMQETGLFPEYAIRMVEAGESSGRLESILFRLSRYYAGLKTTTEKLRSAVIYPCVMLLLVILVLAVMVTMVLPAFSEVYESLTGSLAASSYGYIRLAFIFSWVALIVMVILAVILIVGLILWRTGHRETVEKVLRRFPSCEKILGSMGLYRFTSALSTFLASGEMQDEAVRRSIPMTEYKPLEEKLQRCAASMEEGHSIATAAYDEKLFEPVYGRMLLAGERSGNLESVLEHLTELLEEDCGSQVDRLVGTIDPALSSVLMVTLGISLLSVMLPLIGMMNSVG